LDECGSPIGGPFCLLGGVMELRQQQTTSTELRAGFAVLRMTASGNGKSLSTAKNPGAKIKMAGSMESARVTTGPGRKPITLDLAAYRPFIIRQ